MIAFSYYGAMPVINKQICFKMKLVSISGGRSSAMMLKIMSDNGLLSDAVVCFANTGKESAATLEFIEECSQRWGIPVVWLEYIPEKPFFRIVDFETASREGEPFKSLIEKRKALPNAAQRWCTGDLKIKTIRRFAKSIGLKKPIDTYIGLRFDEPTRVARKKAQNAAGVEAEYYHLPLYDMRITVKQRNDFWAVQPFDLKISSHRDNCDLCFMKGKNHLILAIRECPESAEWWINMEENTHNKKYQRHARFRKEYTYSELKQVALSQKEIQFNDFPDQSLTCTCTD